MHSKIQLISNFKHVFALKKKQIRLFGKYRNIEIMDSVKAIFY